MAFRSMPVVRKRREEVVTQCVNLRTDDYDVYIGRGSRWGNPFKIGEHGSRERVIELFRDYAAHMYVSGRWTKEVLLRLKDKKLGCYCAPRACHGDVLIELIELVDSQ